MLTRLFRTGLLAFALLLAQHGAAWHAVSHYASDASSGQSDKKPLHTSDACEKCIVFAQLGAAAAATPTQDLPRAVSIAPAAGDALFSRTQFVPLYRSRAPPVLA